MLNSLKQIAVISACCFIAMPVFAQTAASTTKAPSAKSSISPEKSKMLCKAWKLDTYSAYGVDNKAGGKQANDAITFVADGTFFITQDGVSSTGTWTYVAGHINAVTTNPDAKLSFKLVDLTDVRLVLDYQYPAPDLSRVEYTYSPKK